jgi:uncharacterized membrane protein HdeD (DUF308 family)
MPRRVASARIGAMSTAASAAGPRVVDDDAPGRFWWIPLVAGVLSLIVGVVALAYPGPTLLVVGILFGAYLAAWGTMLVIESVRGEGAPTFARVLGVIVGLLGVLAGLILLVRPGESVVTAALVLGFWWVLSGVMQLARGISTSEGRTWNVLLGILGLLAGIIILAQPEIGLITLVWIVGFGLIFQGIIEIVAGLGIRRLHKEGFA